jgi:hypothetical protein
MKEHKAQKEQLEKEKKEQLLGDQYGAIFQARKGFLEKTGGKNSVAASVMTEREKMFVADIIKDVAAKMPAGSLKKRPEEYAALLMGDSTGNFYKSALSVLSNQGDPSTALERLRANLPPRVFADAENFDSHKKVFMDKQRSAANLEAQPGRARVQEAPPSSAQPDFKPKVVRRDTAPQQPAKPAEKPSLLKRLFGGGDGE